MRPYSESSVSSTKTGLCLCRITCTAHVMDFVSSAFVFTERMFHINSEMLLGLNQSHSKVVQMYTMYGLLIRKKTGTCPLSSSLTKGDVTVRRSF